MRNHEEGYVIHPGESGVHARHQPLSRISPCRHEISLSSAMLCKLDPDLMSGISHKDLGSAVDENIWGQRVHLYT